MSRTTRPKRHRHDDWVEPDLEHARAELSIECELSYQRRSCIPDPLEILVAAESGRPILFPIFPINAFTPTSACPHKGAIRRGSVVYCPSCHASGLDHRPELARDPATDPKPEAVADSAAPPRPETPHAAEPALTRKQRRALQFAQQGTPADARDDAEPPVAQR